MKTPRCALLALWLVFTVSATAQPLSDGPLVEALRAGGYVIVMRHGATHADQADTDPLNVEQPGNEARQRHLNDKGRAAAKAVGESFRAMKVPVGLVVSSKLARAQETARLMQVGVVSTSWDVTEGNQVVSPNENNRRAAALRTMAATPPAPGTNTLIVTHKPNVVDAFGKDWFEVKEGEASVFRPDGNGGFSPVARVQMDAWSALARR
ncbi:MAG: histidine phosphatase family protein [Usitatibacter sp.]